MSARQAPDSTGTKKTPVMIHIDQDSADRLTAESKRSGLSRSAIGSVALRAYLAGKLPQPQVKLSHQDETALEIGRLVLSQPLEARRLLGAVVTAIVRTMQGHLPPDMPDWSALGIGTSERKRGKRAGVDDRGQ